MGGINKMDEDYLQNIINNVGDVDKDYLQNIINNVGDVIKTSNVINKERIATNRKKGFGLSDYLPKNLDQPVPAGRGIVNPIKEYLFPETAEKTNEEAAYNAAVAAHKKLPPPAPAAPQSTFDQHGGDINSILKSIPSGKAGDEKFKAIVDLVKDHPDFENLGAGYIQDAKGGNIQRVLNQPKKAEEYGYHPDLSQPLNPIQAKATAELMHGVGAIEGAKASRAYHEAALNAGIESKAAVLEETKNKNIQTQLDKFSMVNGVPDAGWGYFQLANSGMPLTGQHKTAAEETIAPLKLALDTYQKKLGKTLTPLQIRLTTERYKRSRGWPFDEEFLKKNE